VTFNSLQFVGFLAVVLTLYWVLRGRPRQALLLAASYAFYGMWDLRFLGLLLVMSVATYAATLRIERGRGQPVARKWLVGLVLVDLGVLCFFKYANFFIDSAESMLQALGLHPSRLVLQLFVPIGISFYVFESISYAADVFRGKAVARRDPVVVGLFLSYFPKALAGPIERPGHLMAELEHGPTPPTVERVVSALLLIVLGLFQKVFLADLAATAVNEVFGRPGVASAPALVLGAYGFAVQIYGDFAGYTNIARGVSRLFGIELVLNFREPYLSRNPVEFWRRWHISLSTWLRDYLYVPLGGNRRGSGRTSFNLMVTMLLGGLWHGASWTFVVWGGLHGTYLVAHRVLTRGGRTDVDSPVRWSDLWRILGWFQLVCLAWIFFRMPSLGDALTAVVRIVTLQRGESPARLLIVPPLMLLTLAMDLMLRHYGSARRFLRAPAAVQGVAIGLVVTAVVFASGGQGAPFIYFAF